MDIQKTLVQTIEQSGVQNAKAILAHYNLPLVEVGAILQNYQSIVVQSDDDTETMELAKKQKAILVKARTQAKKNHDTGKAESLAIGRAFDKAYNFIVATLQPAEEHLKLQSDYLKIKAEKAHQELANSRLEQIRIAKQDQDIDTDTITKGFDSVTDEVFTMMINSIKTQADNMIAQAKADKLEQERKEKERLELLQKTREQERLLAEQQAEIDRQNAEKKKLEQQVASAEQAKSIAEELSMPIANIDKQETDLQRLLEYAKCLRNIQSPTIHDPALIKELAKMQTTLHTWLDAIIANLESGL